jgi:hypothetical protein
MAGRPCQIDSDESCASEGREGEVGTIEIAAGELRIDQPRSLKRAASQRAPREVRAGQVSVRERSPGEGHVLDARST